MKLIKTLLTILFISLLSSPGWSETSDDLVEREGLLYKKFTDVPYTGMITGKSQGSIKNGKWDGTVVTYDENGQLLIKENYKNGKLNGNWVAYDENGQLWIKQSFKNGKKDGAWVSYFENEKLGVKGNYKNGKKDGVWVAYFSKGNAWKKLSGTFKDDVKISD